MTTPSRQILLVYSYPPTHIGGVEAVMDALGRAYAEQGHRVTVVGGKVDGPPVRPPSEHYELVELDCYDRLETRFRIPYPMPTPGAIRRLLAHVRRAQVIHAHGFLNALTTAAFLAARQRRPTPALILTEHVGFVPFGMAALDAIERLAIATVGRLNMRLAHATTVLNARVDGELRRLVAGAEPTFIENGIDHEVFRPADPTARARLRRARGWDEQPRVLFVGRLVARKGIALAVEAARAARGAFRLVVAGSGRLPAQADPGLVEFLGVVNRAELVELYQAADLFLLPSRSEGFPVTAQEALASGLPCVLGDDPAYASYLPGAGLGLHLAPLDARAIARTIDRLLGDRAQLARARRDAARYARARFTWPDIAQRYRQVWERVLDAR